MTSGQMRSRDNQSLWLSRDNCDPGIIRGNGCLRICDLRGNCDPGIIRVSGCLRTCYLRGNHDLGTIVISEQSLSSIRISRQSWVGVEYGSM